MRKLEIGSDEWKRKMAEIRQKIDEALFLANSILRDRELTGLGPNREIKKPHGIRIPGGNGIRKRRVHKD